MRNAPSEHGLPTRLGAFAIAGVLGEGGSGVVYDATWGHRRVALKVLRDELLETPRERDRFLAEAQLLQSIDHPGVVKVLGSGTLPDGRPYLAMEHLDGESLAHRVARAPLALGEALALFAQLADAVAAMHDRGLVHRDIKPENIFVVGGHAVLLDFGIAKAEDAAPSTTTQEGSIRGTPAYMAPERFFGSPATVATDIYELAVVLYVMIAARLPWTDVGDPTARLDPPRPSTFGVAVPAALETALVTALSSRAEARPASARELAARVQHGATGVDVGQRVTAPLRPAAIAANTPGSGSGAVGIADTALAGATAKAADTAPRSARSRRRTVVFAGVVIAGGITAGAVMLSRHHDAPAPSAQPNAAAPAPNGAMLDGERDPWSGQGHPNTAPIQVATGSTTESTTPSKLEIAAHPVAVPAALASQLDLHPADADFALVVSGAKLRASAAMTLASKTSVELAQLASSCGFDVLASVDEVVITGKVDGLALALDVSARGRLDAAATEKCIAVLLGGSHPTTTHDGDLTRIEGGSRTLWVSHPDTSTVYITTRDREAGKTRDPSVRRGPIAKLVPMIDAGAALWLVGSPQGAAGELLPGVAPPRAMYASVALTAAIDIRGGFRFADPGSAVTASHALRGKLDELRNDPIGRSILGDSKVGVTGSDATFSVAVPETFAAATLQSLLKQLAP